MPIPKEILEELERDWEALVTVPEGMGLRLIGVAIEGWDLEAASDNHARQFVSEGGMLRRGIVRRKATLTLAVYTEIRR